MCNNVVKVGGRNQDSSKKIHIENYHHVADSHQPHKSHGHHRHTANNIDETDIVDTYNTQHKSFLRATPPNSKAIQSISNPVAGATTIPPGVLKGDMEQYRDAINRASAATGIPAEIIAGQIWAESRDSLNNPRSSRNSDGSTDIGLMQISQGRYDNDVKNAVNGPRLDVTKPADNIMAGAFELKNWLKQSNNNMNLALQRYVGAGDAAGYAKNVIYYSQHLSNLPDVGPFGKDG
jgi:soluble lytic murein transglycosylase-like protein